MGPCQDRPLPNILCFRSSLKYPGNYLMHISQVVLQMLKPHQMEDINYLMTLSTSPADILEPED